MLNFIKYSFVLIPPTRRYDVIQYLQFNSHLFYQEDFLIIAVSSEFFLVSFFFPVLTFPSFGVVASCLYFTIWSSYSYHTFSFHFLEDIFSKMAKMWTFFNSTTHSAVSSFNLFSTLSWNSVSSSIRDGYTTAIELNEWKGENEDENLFSPIDTLPTTLLKVDCRIRCEHWTLSILQQLLNDYWWWLKKKVNKVFTVYRILNEFSFPVSV